MEKIDKNFESESQGQGNESKKDSSLQVEIFRHGKAKYEQGNVPVEEADDLTPEGIEEVRRNAEKMAELIKPDEEVAILSSPLGRNLQTAKIIADVLEQKRPALQDGEEAGTIKIKKFKELSEVENFSWHLFEPLVNGGETEFAGERFFVDKKLTNPENLTPSEYFFRGAIENISAESKKQFPEEYVKEIERFEKSVEATKRIIKVLSRLAKLKDKPYHVIIVTHDALAGFIANIFSSGEKFGTDPGEFINLEKRGNKLVATRIGDLKDGKTDLDVIDEFNRKTR